MKFTSEEAFNASEAGDPIWLSCNDIRKICGEHGLDHFEYHDDCGSECLDPTDAAVLLTWLGY